MKQFVAHHLVRQAERLGQPFIREPAGLNADLLITLESGQQVAVYIVNYGVRSADLDEQLTANTAKGVYSLYVLDGRMLPPDGALLEPPHWMTALHGALRGRVYGYWCKGREVTIRPVHFEWRWGDERRRVLYGHPVEWGSVTAARSESTSAWLPGVFATAEFGEGPFWKRRDPNAGQARKYSWREWSFGPKKTASAEETADRDEAFQRHYGDVWGEEVRFRRRQKAQQQRARRPADAPAAAAPHRHYQVLGVPHTASNDEVKRAYRRMARENHPDLHPNERDKYHLRMAEINAAFEAINRERDAEEE